MGIGGRIPPLLDVLAFPGRPWRRFATAMPNCIAGVSNDLIRDEIR
jgi:hypothetical protein